MNIKFKLKTKLSDDFKSKKISTIYDIDVVEKGSFDVSIENCDFKTKYNIGLIIGNSGTGKSSVLREYFGYKPEEVDLSKSVVQHLNHLKISEIEDVLYSNCLSDIPAWLKPMSVLSNGQRARALQSIELSKDKDIYFFDEFTSVVDRLTAMSISKNFSKYVKKADKKVVIASCHYDIIEDLKPDWILDLNELTFTKDIEKYYSKKKESNLQLGNLKEKNSNEAGQCLASFII